jgi:hypothetical protein
MAAVCTRAFRDTLSQILFPPGLRHLSQEDQETPWRASRTIRRMRDGKVTLVVVETADDGEETVVGMAQWVQPVDKNAGAPSPPSSGGTVVAEEPAPATLDSEALDGFMKLLEEETKKVLGPDGSKHMWCECWADWSLAFNVLTSRLRPPRPHRGSRSPSPRHWRSPSALGDGAGKRRGKTGLYPRDARGQASV